MNGSADGAENGEGADGPIAATGAVGDGSAVVDVGFLVANAADGRLSALRSFTERLARDAADELGRATEVPWRFFPPEPEPQTETDAVKPSAFLDAAMERMVDGPYDLVIVVTDRPLRSRRDRLVPGLASPLSRVAVLSTHGLARNRRRCEGGLDDPAMRWNGATLLVHLVGHLLGAGHGASTTGGRADAEERRAAAAGADETGDAVARGEGAADGEGAMDPFAFDPSRRSIPPFDADVRRHLERVAADVPQTEVGPGRLRRATFHLKSLARKPGQVARAVLGSSAPLLPLSMPRLSTAAIVPSLVLVFSAETWDVGINLTNASAAQFAVVSVVAAAIHVLYAQDLLFPQRPREVLTEHTALVNVTIVCILLLAMVGLFALVGAVMLVIELVVFPPNLMTNWPSLEDPSVGLVDVVRTAAFISTVGMLSGALGGGLESRTLVQHLALFQDRP